MRVAITTWAKGRFLNQILKRKPFAYHIITTGLSADGTCDLADINCSQKASYRSGLNIA